MASIFTRIVQGEIPCYKIAETNDYLAFLDVSPVEKGHTLVIPKKEIDYIFDLDDDLLSGLHLFAKKVAKAVESVVSCQRIGIAVVGLEVAHTHVHLIPLQGIHSLNFGKERVKMSSEEFAELAAGIKNAFDQQ